MTTTRRRLLASGLAGLAVMTPALAQRTGAATPRRMSMGDLDLDDPILETLRTAIERLKAASASDAVSWMTITGIHGSEQGFNRCPHRNWYFLPWHRAYLVMLERIVRSVSGNPNFALPYWDWTTDRQLPRAFTEPTWNGRPNPLFEPSRMISPHESLETDMVGSDVVAQILAEPSYEIFGTSRPSGQNSVEERWVSSGRGRQGPLESNPHNGVHGTIGGLMGGSASAVDPVFWMHHCNIDRLWAVWSQRGNLNTTDPLWRDMTFTDHFLTPQGRPYSARVRDMRNILPLGYRYGLDAPVAAVQVASSARVAQVFRGEAQSPQAPTSAPRTVGGGGGVAPATVFTAVNSKTGEPGKPVEVQVPVDAQAVARFRRRGGPAAGADTSTRSVASSASAPADQRVLALISDIKPPTESVTRIRVFLNCDYLTANTPVSDPHYVGTFSFFGGDKHAGHAGHGPQEPAISLDLTATLTKITRAGYAVQSPLRVQLLPVVPQGRAQAGTSMIVPGKVEIVFV